MQDLLKNVKVTVKARFVFKVIYKVETFIYVLLIQIMFQKKFMLYTVNVLEMLLFIVFQKCKLKLLHIIIQM